MNANQMKILKSYYTLGCLLIKRKIKNFSLPRITADIVFFLTLVWKKQFSAYRKISYTNSPKKGFFTLHEKTDFFK